ncbi:AAA family ATPase [Nocardia sp. NPDC051030]|uniref:helix-turn-helix transcriptional regulator n=1 Tax=Nocardia sp. NPDC051030 TaxID=3155162 RepID=UPI00341DB6F2
MLYGRSEELRRIGDLLGAARSGRSGALALLGDPGEGKSALLDRAADLVDDSWLVLRCTGVESESELPFAGLQLLLCSVLDRIGELPAQHRNALRTAFGLCAEPAADRFAVGMAAVALLAELSASGPVLCLIDDAQWLDRASADALLFAAHRLGAESSVLLIAGRPQFTTQAVPTLRLTPLDDTQSRTLLGDQFPDLTAEVRDRVLTEAAGNPLAVLELPRMVDSRPVGPLPLPDRLRSGYQEHIGRQPESARIALLVSAAEETGDVTVVRGALARLGHGEEALVAAENSRMIQIFGDRVAFRHPLRRAAAYQLAPFTQRQAVHAAIAEALAGDPDRRAWHLAFATVDPDEKVAAALDAAAERALQRAAFAAAAAALERAARLTPDGIQRGRRMLRAVDALIYAGRPEQALAVADRLDICAMRISERAWLRDRRAHIAFESGSLAEAYELWSQAAAELAVPHPDRAAIALIDAARAAWTAGDLPGARSARARMGELALDDSWAPLLAAIDGPNRMFSMDLDAGVELIRRGVAAAHWVTDPATRFTLALLASLAADIDEALDLLIGVGDEYCRLGMVGRLPAVHTSAGTMQLLLGRLPESEATCLEAVRLAEATGQPNRVRQGESILAVLAALRGDEDRCRELADRQLGRSQPLENTIDTAHCEWALLLLDLAHGRFEAAVHRGEGLGRGPHRLLGQWPHLLADRVEAAVRLRAPERAAEPLEALERYTRATDSDWMRGLLLRCHALLDGDGDTFELALAQHAEANRCFDHARTELLYGEWLRRERRLLEARARLDAAAIAFERLGARPWAERARAELGAAGGDSSHAPEALRLLTPQELQVVRLAARGATNNEIGAQLSLSPKTVGHHLYRAFPKLGVHSRVELVRLLPAEIR